MDFLENQLSGDAGFERTDTYTESYEDNYLQRVDGAISQTIARAIREATQTTDPALQREAASWLWICCPDIAEQVELPELQDDTMTSLAAVYLMGDAGARKTSTRFM